jgi:hypothetical protein
VDSSGAAGRGGGDGGHDLYGRARRSIAEAEQEKQEEQEEQEEEAVLLLSLSQGKEKEKWMNLSPSTKLSLFTFLVSQGVDH